MNIVEIGIDISFYLHEYDSVALLEARFNKLVDLVVKLKFLKNM